MSKTNEQKASEGGAVHAVEYREDPRIEIARGGPISFSRNAMARLGILGKDESIEELRERILRETGGRYFKGGKLAPQDQAKKDRALLHVARMDAIRAKSLEGVEILKGEVRKMLEEAKLYPERDKPLHNEIAGLLHYIDIGLENGSSISAVAIEDGNYAFQKELESASRENQRNLRVYKEEHVKTVAFQDIERKIKEFTDD